MLARICLPIRSPRAAKGFAVFPGVYRGLQPVRSPFTGPGGGASAAPTKNARAILLARKVRDPGFIRFTLSRSFRSVVPGIWSRDFL